MLSTEEQTASETYGYADPWETLGRIRQVLKQASPRSAHEVCQILKDLNRITTPKGEQ